MSPSSTEAQVYGLTYPPSFIDTLPRTGTGIPILSASQFSSLHFQHILSHPPDSVLFPFLHGIEGDNEAQNMFFATQGRHGREEEEEEGKRKTAVPLYRGMMWVISEDDLDNPEKELKILFHREEDEGEISEESSYFDDTDTNTDTDSDSELVSPDTGMELDVGIHDSDEPSPPDEVRVMDVVSLDENDQKYMHPVQHHMIPPIRTTHFHPNLSQRKHSSKPSPPILTSTFLAQDLLRPVPGTEHDGDEQWEFVPLHVPEGISLRNFGIQVPILSTISDIIIYSPTSTGAATSKNALRLASRFKMAIERKWRERFGVDDTDSKTDEEDDTRLHYNVFLLDASADDIRKEMSHLVVKLCSQGEVPGVDGAGTTAMVAKLNGCDEDGDVVMSDADSAPPPPPPLPNPPPPPPPPHRSSSSGTIAHPRPNTVNFAQREKDEMRDLTRASEIVSVFPDGHPLAWLNPNSTPMGTRSMAVSIVNGDYMKDAGQTQTNVDLRTTQTFYDPMVGQVFLGNANDVPLPVDGMGDFGEVDGRWGMRRFFESGGCSKGEGESLSGTKLSGDQTQEVKKTTTAENDNTDKPTPAYPPGNSPLQGHGYDICIECHDLAPFPTLAHLKASEEKIGRLEESWRKIVEEGERGERQRLRRESSRTGEMETEMENSKSDTYTYTYTLPPRPPPHPNAIIHLPMPSSPPATAATMGIMMPIVRFLQRCVMSTGGVEVEVVEAESGPSSENGSSPFDENKDERGKKRERESGTDVSVGVDVHESKEKEKEKEVNKSRRWSSVSSLIPLPSFPGFNIHAHPPPPPAPIQGPVSSSSSSSPSRHRSMTSPPPLSTSTSHIDIHTRNEIPTSQSPPLQSTKTRRTLYSYRIQHHSSSLSPSSSSSPSISFPSSSSSSSSSSSPYSELYSYTSTTTTPPPFAWSRPLKILLYSADGYTESSVPALFLLMAIKGLNLPRAYLELQVAKRRSFFVYSSDLGVLRRWESVCEGVMKQEREERERALRLEREREERDWRWRVVDEERKRTRERERSNSISANGSGSTPSPSSPPSSSLWSVNPFGFGFGTQVNSHRTWGPASGSGVAGSMSTSSGDHRSPSPRPPLSSTDTPSQQVQHLPQKRSGGGARPTAKSVSFASSGPGPSSTKSGPSLFAEPVVSVTEFSAEADGVGGSGSGSMRELGTGGLKGSATLPPLPASTGMGMSMSASASVPAPGSSPPSLHGPATGSGRRPRASTSPWLPSQNPGLFGFGGDHQAWFNDPRFDGSFPSRVLPFLYLGNLAHASNVYMLQALGITHVVSVGECALVPPPPDSHSHPHHAQDSHSYCSFSSRSAPPYLQSQPHHYQGSLWIEERAGRIKVLDIQGVCDDGIDTLEPQLEPICDWIDQARMEGGQVLVHCRVGVSRSATVTIAYVMKHLSLSLVDAYLIVRSRRLSVLIQPNMRLLYNLLGWEIKLAKERVGIHPDAGLSSLTGDAQERLKRELEGALSWPYLAKEVHKLNEKYLS